ncbi:hypothetical protein J5N97_015602 [Dioscorea zingiberensis]|uniref:Zinc finger CCCH domain-containing protein 18-like n=1 Tax=Dioscorea zingiberensis TaxID=325984 RepID=A0A9D5HEU7_9LILI|nr:hypothetical protein J5N97_015602 [Dioscorea zingiberensis]
MLCLHPIPHRPFVPSPSRISPGVSRHAGIGFAVYSSHSSPRILKPNRGSSSSYDDDDDSGSEMEEYPPFNDDLLDMEEFSSNGHSDKKPSSFYSSHSNNKRSGYQRSPRKDKVIPEKISSKDLNNISGGSAKANQVDLSTKVKVELGKFTESRFQKLAEELDFDEKWFPLIEYLSTFGLKETHFISIYEKHMPCLQINLASAQERLEFLLDVGVKHKDIKRILMRQPQILEYTVEKNLKSHVSFLVDIGIPHSRIGHIITSAPSLFSYSVEHSLKPTVRYLVEEVGIKRSNVSKVIQLSPQILVQRLDNSWNSRFSFLSKELGAPRDSIVKMVTKHPQLLHYSIEDGISPRIEFLRSIGMQNSDILKVLTRLAQVLSLSLEDNLKPKYLYLVNDLHNEVKSLTKYPMYLSLSLEQRIRPRHRFLVSLKKAPKGDNNPLILSSFGTEVVSTSLNENWNKLLVLSLVLALLVFQLLLLLYRPNMVLLLFYKKQDRLERYLLGYFLDDWLVETQYYEMDVSDLTKIIFNRIQKLESENALKIVGFLFFKEPDEQEMRHLAFGPESAFLSIISEAKAMLNISAKTNASAQAAPEVPHQFSHYPSASAASRSFPSPLTLHVPDPFWDSQLASDQQHSMNNLDYVPCRYTLSVGDDYSLSNQAQFMGLEEQMDQANTIGSNFSNNFYYHDTAMGGGLTSKTSRRSPGLPDFPIKACHYFYRGYCKHGHNCRYFHGQPFQDGYSQVFSQNLNETANEEHGFSAGSLDQLEMEIAELLKSRRGQPVSIASLPMLYFEKYGRNIQADGYLTESQRHGKAGFSLTKLLARLKNSIRLIDRPHGQHSVILAEDAAKFMGYRLDRNDPGAIVSSSHQIYLTFPAESTFNEEDVANYFKQYGPVRDVRIPCQEKRMFGFVSFIYPDTVNHLLAMRKPHFICGARVLVKRYREKSRITERTYMDRIKPAMYYNQYAQYLEMDPELQARPRESDSSMMLKKLGQEKMLELERRRLSEFNIVQKPLVQQPYYGFSMDEFKLPEADHFSYVLDALNNGSTSDDKANNNLNGNNFSDPESNPIELPESPFASPVGSSISAMV